MRVLEWGIPDEPWFGLPPRTGRAAPSRESCDAGIVTGVLPVFDRTEVFTMTESNLPPTFARITGFAAILAPVLLLVSTVAYLTAGGGINDGVLGGTVGVWSCIAFAVASMGICRLAEPHAPRAAPIVTVVAFAGWVGGAAFNVQAMFLEKYGNDFLADVTGDEAAGSEWVGFFAFLPWGWMAPLGFILMGWLLWRTRVVATWVAGLLALGGVLFVTGRPARIDVVAVSTDLVLTTALVMVGLELLRRARTAEVMDGSVRTPDLQLRP